MPKAGAATLSFSFAVVHIPHSSTAIPDDVRGQFVLSDEDLEREVLLMTDWHADDLFSVRGPETSAETVLFPVSRLVVDPERFEDDAEEEMAQKGMGVVYSRTTDGRRLRRRISPREREDLLRKYYRPHHERLTKAVGEALRRQGKCLIIDAHSFPSRPLPYEADRSPDRPDVCLGTDEFHTPDLLRKVALKILRVQFKGVEINRPFKGTMVPARYLRRDRRVLSIMIEINRGLYMDERTGEKLPGYEQVKEKIQFALRRMISHAILC